jgi:serine/threonine protein kinase
VKVAELQAENFNLKTDLEFANRDLYFVKEELETLLFMHIPQVSSELKEIGPVNHEVLEESDEQVGDYELLKVLGEGFFGQVFLGRSKRMLSDDNNVAIKVLRKSRLGHIHDLKQLNLEIGVLRRHCHHPNIISLHEVLHAPKHIYMVMEKGTMDLHTLIRHTDMAEDQPDLIQQVMLGILQPLKYLHANGVLSFGSEARKCLDQDFGLG